MKRLIVCVLIVFVISVPVVNALEIGLKLSYLPEHNAYYSDSGEGHLINLAVKDNYLEYYTGYLSPNKKDGVLAEGSLVVTISGLSYLISVTEKNNLFLNVGVNNITYKSRVQGGGWEKFSTSLGAKIGLVFKKKIDSKSSVFIYMDYYYTKPHVEGTVNSVYRDYGNVDLSNFLISVAIKFGVSGSQ